MPTPKNLIAFISLLISLTSFSCHSVKRAALSCPEFPKKPQKTIVTRKPNLKRNNLTINVLKLKRIQSQKTKLTTDPEIIYSLSKNQFKKQMVASIDNRFIPQQAHCDTIFLRSGSWMYVKIIKEGLLNIKFNNCDSSTSSPISVSKKGISKVKYSNGNTDYFGHGIQNVPLVGNISKKNEPIGIIGFISTLMSPFFLYYEMSFIAVGFILGIISYFRIKRHPDKFKGKVLAKISILTMVILTFLGILMALLMSF